MNEMKAQSTGILIPVCFFLKLGVNLQFHIALRQRSASTRIVGANCFTLHMCSEKAKHAQYTTHSGRFTRVPLLIWRIL